MGNSLNKFEQFNDVFKILAKCTDDYLFILDFIEDHFNITERGAERFNIPCADFYNALEIISGTVHPEDKEMLANNLEMIKSGQSSEHDLEYKWLDKNGNAVWISCRGQAIYNEQGQANYLVGRISELGRKNKIDNITGLYREIKLRQDILDIGKPGTNGFLLLIGIDNFKDINERYSKEVGNTTLQGLAECVVNIAGNKAEVYRMSGDEIMLLCTDAGPVIDDPAKYMYKKIRAAVDEKIGEKG